MLPSLLSAAQLSVVKPCSMKEDSAAVSCSQPAWDGPAGSSPVLQHVKSRDSEWLEMSWLPGPCLPLSSLR